MWNYWQKLPAQMAHPVFDMRTFRNPRRISFPFVRQSSRVRDMFQNRSCNYSPRAPGSPHCWDCRCLSRSQRNSQTSASRMQYSARFWKAGTTMGQCSVKNESAMHLPRFRLFYTHPMAKRWLRDSFPSYSTRGGRRALCICAVLGKQYPDSSLSGMSSLSTRPPLKWTLSIHPEVTHDVRPSNEQT